MSPSRPQGMSGPRGITLGTVHEYDSVYGIIGDVDEFVEITSRMDAVYLPIKIRQMKSAKAAQAPQQPGVARSRSDLGKVTPPTSKQIR